MTKSLTELTVSEIHDEVASLSAQVAAMTGRLLELLGELDHRGALQEGFVSLAHWLSWRTGLRLPAAREHVRVARALRELPATGAALQAGDISYSKARAITRVATPKTEEQLLDYAKDGSASQLERIVRGARVVGLAEQTRAARIEQQRQLDTFYDDDGMLVVRARLAPEEGALLLRALEAAQRDAAGSDRAAALARVAELALDGGGAPAAARRGDRTQVIVHVDRAVLRDPSQDGRSHLQDGPSVAAETSRRLACDAAVVIMEHGPDGELTAGRRRRIISTSLRRKVSERDHGHCVFPGCSNRIVDCHHAVHWGNDGPTVLTNLALLCRRHHVLVHDRGYRVEIDGPQVRVLDPRGQVVVDAPAPPPRSAWPAPSPPPSDPWNLAPTWSPVCGIDYEEAVRSVLPDHRRPR